ncbi:MAG: hypothetical protein AAGB11_00385 [Pseudomonadota bacterium]
MSKAQDLIVDLSNATSAASEASIIENILALEPPDRVLSFRIDNEDSANPTVVFSFRTQGGASTVEWRPEARKNMEFLYLE